MITKNLIFASIFGMTCTMAAIAGETESVYHCKNGDAVREVSIVRVNAGSSVPCEVYDRKFRDGTPRLIYSAQFDHAFCVDKAAEFVGRLVKGFWECEQEVLIAEAAPPPQAAPVAADMSLPGTGDDTVAATVSQAGNEAAEPAIARGQSAGSGQAADGTARSGSVPVAKKADPIGPAASAVETGEPKKESVEPAPAGKDPAIATVAAVTGQRKSVSEVSDSAAIKSYLAATSEYRFAAEDLGEEVFVDAVDVVSRDINDDGQPEIFVRLNHERYQAPTACAVWDLYTVGSWEFDDDTGIALEEELAAGMGMCDVIALDTRTGGYEDLLIRVNTIDGSLSVKLIKFYFGGYRVMEHHTYNAEAGTTRILRTSIEGETTEETESGKSGLIKLYESGVPIT